MGEAVYALDTCYKGGALGWFLAWMAVNMGSGLYMGYAWYAMHRGELYFLLAASTALTTVVLAYELGVLYDPHVPMPYGLVSAGGSICPGQYNHFLPTLAMALLIQYWVLCVCHEFYLGMTVTWSQRIRRTLLVLVTTIILVWSDNSTILNVVYGGILGLVQGVLWCAVLTFIWVPRLPNLNPHMRLFNLKFHRPLLDDYHAKHPSRADTPLPTFF